MKQNYKDILSEHCSNIGLTHLEEMVIKTNPELPSIVTIPYHLPLKHHKFIKEEIENLLKTRLTERSMSPYAIPVIVVPRKCKPGVPSAEMKRVVINYQELNKHISKVQMTQAKSKGSLTLIEMAKINHIWSRLKGKKYFTMLHIRSENQQISIHPELRPKTSFTS